MNILVPDAGTGFSSRVLAPFRHEQSTNGTCRKIAPLVGLSQQAVLRAPTVVATTWKG